MNCTFCLLRRLPLVYRNIRLCTSDTITLPKAYEPPYLSDKPSIPFQPPIILVASGHDYAVVERFAKHIHRTCKFVFKLNADGYPMPTKKSRIDLHTDRSTVLKDSFALPTYERIVSLNDLKSVDFGILVNFFSHHIPEGVTLTVREPSDEDTENRYVPDLEVRTLKEQLDKLGVNSS